MPNNINPVKSNFNCVVCPTCGRMHGVNDTCANGCTVLFPRKTLYEPPRAGGWDPQDLIRPENDSELDELVQRGIDSLKPKASAIQIGGEHYNSMPIQPYEFITKNNISYGEANVIKYVCRHRHKNGLEDLKKAKHYIDLIIEDLYKEEI